MHYQLIVGLGNPGSGYVQTRHNIGFRVIDAFAARKSVSWRKERAFKAELAVWTNDSLDKCYLLKPLTFMNASGAALQKVCGYYKIPPESVVVIYDEINLPVGEVKISLGGSAGGHNGLADILHRLPPRFTRLRIGIGQKPHKEMDLADHVLGKFTAEEESLVSASMDRYLDSLDRLLEQGPEKAMNHINRKQKNDDSNRI